MWNLYLSFVIKSDSSRAVRFDSVRSRSDRFDPIHYPFVQTNTAKIYNSDCHLDDLLKKITMNKEHQIHQTASNIIIVFVMFDKNQIIGIFWQQFL